MGVLATKKPQKRLFLPKIGDFLLIFFAETVVLLIFATAKLQFILFT